MKNLTYITQGFAMLLLMQLSSCDKMPGPEPISSKYTRPDEVIAPGVPIFGAGGSSVYSPTKNTDFRFGASILANADGSVSSWFTLPGGSSGDMPAPVNLYTGENPPANFSSGAVRYQFDKAFYEWSMFCPSWSSKEASAIVSIYEWRTDYQTTITGKALATHTHVHYKDNSWLTCNADDGYTDVTGNIKFPAGTYLLLVQRTEDSPAGKNGSWRANSIDNLICFRDGKESPSNEAHKSCVQYVNPKEVSYAAQVKYIKGSSPVKGMTWEATKDAVAPTKDKADAFYAKEPSVVKVAGYYYMAYTGSATVSEEKDNCIFIARCATIDGKWEKWDGMTWGGDPLAVIKYQKPEGESYGAGAPSMVIKDGQIYLYYSYSDELGSVASIRLMTANASEPNWPSALTDKGIVIDRSSFGKKKVDGCNIVYVEATNKFQAVHAVDYDAVNSYAASWESADGITGWKQVGTLTTNVRIRASFFRFLCDDQGHIQANTPSAVFYQYGLARNSLKTWLSPYSFSAK